MYARSRRFKPFRFVRRIGRRVYRRIGRLVFGRRRRSLRRRY